MEVGEGDREEVPGQVRETPQQPGGELTVQEGREGQGGQWTDPPGGAAA